MELAIYQAFRFDFDLGRAAMLSHGPDLSLAGTAQQSLALSIAVPPGFGAGSAAGWMRIQQRFDNPGGWRKIFGVTCSDGIGGVPCCS